MGLQAMAAAGEEVDGLKDGKFLSPFELLAALHVSRPERCIGWKIEMKTSKVSASEDKILN